MGLRPYLFILALCAICLMPVSAIAKDAGAWQAAKAEFAKDATNNNDQKRIEVTANLAGVVTPDAEPEAAGLLIEQIANELSRNKTGKEEEKVSIHVIDACIAGLRKMTADKAVALLIKKATAATAEWRLRFYVVKALAGINKPEVIKNLVNLIKDKESAIQMAAIEALSQINSAEGAEPVGKLLVGKSVWEVKLAAIDYLRMVKSPDSLKYLKEASHDPNIEPRVLATLLEALEELTAGGSESDNSTRSVIRGEYYGVKIKSSRIVFVMDTSGSMEWAAKEEPATPQDKVSTDHAKKEVVTGSGSDGKPVDNSTSSKIPPELKNKKKDIDSRPVKKRIDSVKKELVNAIYGLDDKVYFSIVFYNSAISVWKNELVPATNENKMAAITAIERLSPSGRTNIYDALEAAYKMVGSAGMAKNEPKRVATGGGKGSPSESISGADTIFLLTDGNPNIGKIPDSQGIIDAVRKLNETRKIKINTIAVGVPDPDNPDPMSKGDTPNTSLMSQLAGITGGTFVDKTK